jgi:hypothetical protein
VQGRVIDADGQPFARGLIRAFDKDMRNEKQLGSDTTYSSPVRFCSTKEETIALVISREAYHGSSEFDRLVAELRPLRGNIPPDELTVDDITSQVVYT